MKAGCDFHVETGESKIPWLDLEDLAPTDNMIFISISWPCFGTFDSGAPHAMDLYYIPTTKRLDDVGGEDWYC